MKLLITGIAGFIGFHVARRLAERGHEIVGIDNFSPYYDVALKRARADALGGRAVIHEIDLADHAAVADVFEAVRPDVAVHLAAQPGVRYSIDHPFEYVSANVAGHLSVLEGCRHSPSLRHLVYASSSSVYGEDSPVPFSVDAPAVNPVSLYAATKRSGELISSTYAHLYGLKQIGLRFFTVYGSWGRPDMAYWTFTEAILSGQPIKVFNQGRMRRDMTHVSDVVAGVVAAVEAEPRFEVGDLPHRLYNVGNSRPEKLTDMIDALEHVLGQRAERVLMPMQPGDVTDTYADIEATRRDLGYEPRVGLEEGLAEFVDWYERWRART